jgi:catechol 2,3-dioxygenase
MLLSLQSVLLNVTDLDRSVQFYEEVLGLTVLARHEQVAVLTINDSGRRHVLVLREVGERAHHGGRQAVGLRFLSLETGSPEDLDVIEQRLAQRGALIGRRDRADWQAVFGVDPDRVDIAVSTGPGGSPIGPEGWERPDDILYQMGE